ncbi:hypothetical protein [Candidatus Palauibacter sp.]|uniref:hypothetical protein n=1 Tax=Candidatus Palauibacter sp. TaxID=3101350 RepID=UPI003AF2DC3E
MFEKEKRCGARGTSIRYALITLLALGSLPGVGSAQEPEEAAETIQNVQLVFHLVEADGFTDEAPEISDVVAELRKLFSFRGYRLLSTSMLNVGLSHLNSSTVSGSGSQRIVLDDARTPLAISTEVRARRATRTVRATVTLTDLVPLPLLEASVTIRDGQRVVVGSARRSADAPVLILIVTPKIDPM